MLIFKALIVAIMGVTVGFKFGSNKSTSIRKGLLSFVQVYDFEKIEETLDQIRQHAKTEFRLSSNGNQGLPSKLVSRFREMNHKVFGKQMVQLFAADGDYSQIHEGKRRIGFPKEILLKIKDNSPLLDFTLAHALSHYIYEFYIDSLSHDRLSPHGQPSRKDEGTRSATPQMAAAHAEIDAIALTIMMRMGHTAKNLAPVLIQDFVTDKKLLDRVMGIEVNEFTTLDYIPEDYRPRVQDNYVRILSLQYTLSRLMDQG